MCITPERTLRKMWTWMRSMLSLPESRAIAVLGSQPDAHAWWLRTQTTMGKSCKCHGMSTSTECMTMADRHRC